MLSLFLFTGGLLMVIFFISHYILILLVLEVMLLSIFFVIIWNFLSFSGIQGLFSYLLIMVCMGGFSISLLVSLARLSGMDFWNFRFIY